MGLEEIRKLKEQANLPKSKKPYYIPKISKKRQEKLDREKQNGTDIGLDIFFEKMRKKCKGRCFFCNQSTTYKNDELWRIAIAHLLPKKHFKSIATDENNWVELCWNCHTDFDSAKITWELLKDSKEWEVLKEKLFQLLPMIPTHERKNKLYSRLERLVYEK